MTEMDPWWESMVDAMFEGVYFVDRERRILLWNEAAERITGYRAEHVLNLRCSEAPLCHIDGSGLSMCDVGCPLAKVMSERTPLETDAWLLHKEGHRLPVRIRARAVLGASGEVVGAIELFDASGVRTDDAEVHAPPPSALVDPLTGAASARVLVSSIQSRLHQASHEGIPFGVVMIGIDRLTWTRTAYGDAVGSELIRMVARTLMSNLAPSDIVARTSEEHFVAIVSAVDSSSVLAAADKLRVLVESSVLHVGGESLRTTVSIGATTSEVADTVDELLARAALLMEGAQRAGGGCVSVGAHGARRTSPAQ